MVYPKDPTNVESKHQKIHSMASLGHISQRRCKLWVRMYCEATWWLVVSDKPISESLDLDTLDGKQVDRFLSDNNITTVYSKSEDIDGTTDQTHTFTITGLTPGNRYYYYVMADVKHHGSIMRRTEIGNQESRYFDSLPQDLSKITFGFYSCHDPFSNIDHGEGAWPSFFNAMSESSALFAIGGGDQVYVDTNEMEDMYSVWKWLAKYKNQIVKDFTNNGKLSKADLIEYFVGIYRNYYRIYWNFINLQKVHARFPNYFIWDDHEIMDGWGSYTVKQRKKLLNRFFQDDDGNTNLAIVELMFEAAKRVYYEYQHAHNPPTPIDLKPTKKANRLCEWDYSFKIGEYGFYVLDQRGHHDYERHDDNNALLGSLQMRRFADWLKSPAAQSAKAVFVVSPVPVVHWGPFVASLDIGPVQDDLRDEWDHESNTGERNKLLKAVFKYSHDNNVPVTFLSGDVHCASVYQLEDTESYTRARVFNGTSSAISRKPAPEKAEWFFKKSGRLKGYPNGDGNASEAEVDRLYAFSGAYNFFLVTAEERGGEVSVAIDLCWPAGTQGELGRKRIQLV